MPVTFKNTGPRGHETPESQKVDTWESDVPKGKDRASHTSESRPEEVYETGPARVERETKERANSKRARTRETAEAAPQETQAADKKPAARTKSAAKKAGDSEK